MARRVDDAQQQLAEVQVFTIAQRTERKLDVGRLVQPDTRTGRLRKRSIARDVVGVQVGIDDVGDVVLALDGELEVGLNVQLRIDDGCFARLSRCEKVRGAACFVVQELLEIHLRAPALVGGMVLLGCAVRLP